MTLYATRPYGVQVLAVRSAHRAGPPHAKIGESRPLRPRAGAGRQPLTVVLAHAAGARWIVALRRRDIACCTGNRDGRRTHRLARPRLRPLCRTSSPSLAGSGDEGEDQHGDNIYDAAQWPAPPRRHRIDLPARSLRRAAPGRRLAIAPLAGEALDGNSRGDSSLRFTRVFNIGLVGRARRSWVDQRHRSDHGNIASRLTPVKLDLPQIVAPARIGASVAGRAPDTGIAHLAKLTGTPTVCLFGPGSDVLFGASWKILAPSANSCR